MRRSFVRRVRVVVLALSASLVIGAAAVGSAMGAVEDSDLTSTTPPVFTPFGPPMPEGAVVALPVTGALPADGMPDDEFDEYETDGDIAYYGGELDNPTEAEWEPQPWSIERGPNWTDRVLLTYDDCIGDPDRFVEVLDHATNNDIGLIIFPTGNCVAMYERWGLDLLAMIRDRGHWVGHHSMTHPDLTRLSRDAIRREITGNVESNILRPPFGAFNNTVIEVAESVGQRIVFWTLDTNDWRQDRRSEDAVVSYIIDNATPGDNVLMHLQWYGFSVQALDRIQSGLAGRGLELCRPAPLNQRPTPVLVPDNIC